MFFRFFIIICICFSALNAQSLKIGTNPYYPPFEYYNFKGEIVGFDIDLLNEIAKRVKFNYTITNIAFDQLIPNLQANKIDLAISAISQTASREQFVDFSNPYFYTKNIYIKLNHDTTIKNKDDLNGKKIGVQSNTTQEITAKQIKNAQIITNKYFATNVDLLKHGEIDAIIVDQAVGLEYLKQNPNLRVFYKENNKNEHFSIAFAKNRHENLIKQINQALQEIKFDGTYNKILKKYGLDK